MGENGVRYTCRVRGKLRLEGIRETNPVAVGDVVQFDETGDYGSIEEILPRTNHILRQSVKKKGHTHVLAANIDQALIVATMASPRTSTGFIDRFIITAESYRIPQVVVFNKQDILSEEEKRHQDDLILLYTKIGIPCLSTTGFDAEQRDLKKILANKTTLVTGHSGVGKSTLLNHLSGDIEQKTAAISDFSDKGTHTTTFAEMFALDKSTYVIDTPGVKEWGVADMVPQEVSDYFIEMRELRLSCKFGSRCLHTQEPGCAIHAAVERGEIALSRFKNYLSIISGEDNRK